MQNHLHNETDQRWKLYLQVSQKTAEYLTFSGALSCLVFLLEFAYALEGLVLKYPLEASLFPISLLQTGQR